MAMMKDGGRSSGKRAIIRLATPEEVAKSKRAYANRGNEGPKKSVPRNGPMLINPANKISKAQTRAEELSGALAKAKAARKRAQASAEGPKRSVAKKNTAKTVVKNANISAKTKKQLMEKAKKSKPKPKLS